MATLGGNRRALAALSVLSVAVVVAAAVGTYTVYKAARPSPVTTTSPRSEAPSQSQDTWAMPSPDVTSGTASLELGSGTIHDRASVPIACTGGNPVSVAIAATTVSLFGERVTVSWEPNTMQGGKLVLARAGAARYQGDLELTYPSDSERLFELKLDPNDQNPATPFGGQGGPDVITAWFYARCNWPPSRLPAPPVDPTFETQGEATLTIGDGAATATLPIVCQWTAKTKASFYVSPDPVELFGERVELDLYEFAASGAGLTIVREGLAANYTGRRGAFEVQGWHAPQGTLRFHQLKLDLDSYPYPRGVPLPMPMDWFLKPLGGLEANRTLDGTLAWDCGTAPEDVPDVELVQPTEPPSDHWQPFPWPDVSVKAGSQSAAAELIICASGIEPADPTAYLPWGCEGYQSRWYIPETRLEAKAGTALTWSVPGWAIASPELAYASLGEVERWRGGQPDATVVLKPVSTSRGSAAFAALPAGDWVVVLSVQGTNTVGDKLTANYAIRIHVAG